MAKQRRHVVPEPQGGWAVRQPGRLKPDSKHRTQGAAEKKAKADLRRAGGGEAVIHGRDGKIRDADTVAPGRDPQPPTDRRH